MGIFENVYHFPLDFQLMNILLMIYLRESIKDVRRKTTLEKYNEKLKKTEAAKGKKK